MEDINRILVVSRDTQYCGTAVHSGVSLARKYGAELYVLHVADDSSSSLDGYKEEEHKRLLLEIQKKLTAAIAAENGQGLTVKKLVREGAPAAEIFKVIKDEQIDLLILLAHAEGRLEHLLFGRSNDEIIRKMPCSILLVKKEPGPVETDELER
ncbi:MAG: universal stress protein [Desulfobulbaceae bacterium]|jgi:nucleotide-binding universal stress UspA family protein|nr:universal stress protein [Desulfobulbaceae bacterium]